jgi:hypothetical protein
MAITWKTAQLKSQQSDSGVTSSWQSPRRQLNSDHEAQETRSFEATAGIHRERQLDMVPWDQGDTILQRL